MAEGYRFQSPIASAIAGKLPKDLPAVKVEVLNELLSPSKEQENWTISKQKEAYSAALLNVPHLELAAVEDLSGAVESFYSAVVSYWEASITSNLEGQQLSKYCDSLATKARDFDQKLTSVTSTLDQKVADAVRKTSVEIRNYQYSFAACAVAVLESAESKEQPDVVLYKMIAPTVPWNATSPTPTTNRQTDITVGSLRTPNKPTPPPDDQNDIPEPDTTGESEVDGSDGGV